MISSKKRFPVFILLFICITFLSSCRGQSTIALAPVVVQCEELRYEQTFPLDEGKIAGLKSYLMKGGDRSFPDIILWYSEKFYSGLLNFLKDTDHLDVSDFFAFVNNKPKLKESLKIWFKDAIFFGLIDSRAQSIDLTSNMPFCLFDGNLWWVFYRDKINRINKLTITVPIVIDLRDRRYKYLAEGNRGE